MVTLPVLKGGCTHTSHLVLPPCTVGRSTSVGSVSQVSLWMLHKISKKHCMEPSASSGQYLWAHRERCCILSTTLCSCFVNNARVCVCE